MLPTKRMRGSNEKMKDDVKRKRTEESWRRKNEDKRRRRKGE